MTTNSETFIIESVPVRLLFFVVVAIALYRVFIQPFFERYSTKSKAETLVLINLRNNILLFFNISSNSFIFCYSWKRFNNVFFFSNCLLNFFLRKNHSHTVLFRIKATIFSMHFFLENLFFCVLTKKDKGKLYCARSILGMFYVKIKDLYYLQQCSFFFLLFLKVLRFESFFSMKNFFIYVYVIPNKVTQILKFLLFNPIVVKIFPLKLIERGNSLMHPLLLFFCLIHFCSTI